MTFTTIEIAKLAAAKFHNEFGMDGYTYRLQEDRKGYLVAVYGSRGHFVTYV